MFDATYDYHTLGLVEPNQINYLCDRFLSESYAEGHKYLLIITGKGISQGQNAGLVKKNVFTNLKKNKLVKKFSEAKPQWGGSGAFEVWLKA